MKQSSSSPNEDGEYAHILCCSTTVPTEETSSPVQEPDAPRRDQREENIDENVQWQCQIDDSQAVEGVYVENENGIVCCLPKKQLSELDVEGTGLRCRVTKGDKVIHDGPPLKLLEGDLSDATHGDPYRKPSVSRKEKLREKYGALIPFAIISVSYLLFTITDGAVRMIVLLHAYSKGFTAMDVAIMFTLYEVAGVVTNLAAGMMGARWGLKTTLLTGLCIQLVGLGMLFGWQNDWSKSEAIIYVTASQMMCGIAKDLTKLGGKTVTKLVTPEGKNSKLFKLVSLITGWKNSLKGAGYFLGAATVAVSYYLALSILVVLIVLAIPPAFFGLSNALGRARKDSITFKQLFQNSHNINILSLSRVFLFGSRDLWFEVPLPFFIRDPASGLGWGRPLTGAFLAIFIIVYGQVQSWTPQLVLHPLRMSPPDKYGAFWWCASLVVPISILGGIMVGTDVFGPEAAGGSAAACLTVLLYAFCILFAVNSAIHSYLIVRYAEGNKVAMQVGVYYASNALGRLTGTIISGALYTYAGPNIVDRFGVCLFSSVVFSTISSAVDSFLHEDQEGSSWFSPFNRCLPRSWLLKGQEEEVKPRELENTGTDLLSNSLEKNSKEENLNESFQTVKTDS